MVCRDRFASNRECFGEPISMASPVRTSHLGRQRSLANMQGRKTAGTLDKDAESAPSRADDALRILSQPAKATVRKKNRKKQRGDLVGEVGLLGTIVTVGISVIIGLRYLAEAFGVYWIGD